MELLAITWGSYYFSCVLILLLHVQNPALGNILCPDVCECSVDGKDVVCADRGLVLIPGSLPVNLATLDLHNNQLTTRTLASALSGHRSQYQALQRLDLGYNLLEEIPADLFPTLGTHLQSLNLTANKISTFDTGALNNLTYLETLDLSNNQLTVVGQNTRGGIIHLQFLNLSNNKIETLGNLSFMNMSELRVLDLSFNQLFHLEAEVFSALSSLEELYLQWNSLTNTIDILNEWSDSLSNIIHIDLSNNRIETQRNVTVPGLSSSTLQELNLSNNNLTALTPAMFVNCSQLRLLDLKENPLQTIEGLVFDNVPNLHTLYLNNCPYLHDIKPNFLQPLINLQFLNISNNPRLSYLPTSLFDGLTLLKIVDLSNNNITSLPKITFQNKYNLEHLYLQNNPFTCDCEVGWIKEWISKTNVIEEPETLNCLVQGSFEKLSLFEINKENLTCEPPIVLTNITDVYYPIGSSALLSCNVHSIPASVITWITPRNKMYIYHNHHPKAVQHLLSRTDVKTGAKFHAKHPWHNSSSYYSDIAESERIVLLDDGSLYIDYVQRQDGGPYQCIIKHPRDNVTLVFTLRLDHSMANVKVMSLIIGVGVSSSFFLLATIFWVIKVAANRCVNQQKRQAIKNIIDNLDAYKTQQIGRIKDIGALQMGKFRDQYHFQLERLRENYNGQMLRIRENCGQQMDKIRDNYTTRVDRLKDYSSNRIERLRDNYNTQIVRIRDYGSVQMEKLRDNYKLQQQHLIKLLETMNLDSCKTVIETDCVRAESMLFDSEIFIGPIGDLPYLLEADPPSIGSGSDDFMTASSNSEDNLSNASEMFKNFKEDLDVYVANEMQLEPGVVIQMPTELIGADGMTLPDELILPPAPILYLPTPTHSQRGTQGDSDTQSDLDITPPDSRRKVTKKRHKRHRRPGHRTQTSTVEVEILLPDRPRLEENSILAEAGEATGLTQDNSTTPDKDNNQERQSMV